MNAAGSAAGPGIHRPGGLLWHRDFRLLWFGETVSQVGTAIFLLYGPSAPLHQQLRLRAPRRFTLAGRIGGPAVRLDI
jgi:hypothetical protein